ncbi:MAG: metalloregulator ArsR/SmtB family transcription factor [Patescibacteria group bacterium]
MKDHEKILKALANHRRLKILKYLRDKKIASVSILAEHLNLSFKSTSKHLAVLFGAGIVEKEQKNLSMLYSLANPLPKVAKQVIGLI